MADIVVELAAKSQELLAAPGDSVRLCLKESPTTGYLWAQTERLPSTLADLGNQFEAASSAIGGGGRRCFLYSCDGEFTTRLRYVLRRPWTPNEIADEVTVTLRCAAAKAR